MDPSTRGPGRLVPAGGGHVPVRVRGFHEDDAPPRALRTGRRFAVGLARSEHDVVKVVDGETVLGYLPEGWSHFLDSAAALERPELAPDGGTTVWAEPGRPQTVEV